MEVIASCFECFIPYTQWMGGLGGTMANLDMAVKRRIPMLLVIKLLKDLWYVALLPDFLLKFLCVCR
jgi:hypothetical protein